MRIKYIATSLLIFIILFISFQSVLAQTYHKSDSLRLVYLQKQSYDTALSYAHQALINMENELGKNDTIYTNMLNAVMEINYYLANYDTAIYYGQQESTILEAIVGKKNRNYANCIEWIGYIYYEMNNYQKAEALYLEAKEIQKEVLGENHSAYATTLNNLAQLYHSMGDHPKAESSLVESWRICKEVLGEEHDLYATTLNNLAELYRVVGNYKKAEPLYIECMNLDRKMLGDKHFYYAISTSNLAGLYWVMGKYEQAEPLLIESLGIFKEVYGEKHPNYAKSLNNLAALYDKMARRASTKELKDSYYQKAEPLYINAMNIYKEVFGEKHHEFAMSVNNLATLYKEMGMSAPTQETKNERFRKADSLYLKAINTYKEMLGDRHSKYATSINNLSALYIAMGSSAITKEDAADNYSKAEPLRIETINIINHNIRQNFSFLSEKEQEMYFKTVSYNFDNFNSFALNRKTDNSEIVNLVYNNTVQNKGLLLKSSTAMRNAILSYNDTLLIRKYENWVSLKKELSQLYSIAVSMRKKDPAKLEEQANILEKDLIKSSQLFSDFVQVQNLNWKDVKDNLKPNEAAIEFVHFRYRNLNWTDTIYYCALIVRPNSTSPEMVKLFNQKDLEDILDKYSGNNNAYINGIYGKNSEAKTSLYDLIWKPMENNLKGVKKVYLSPSGLLHKISFAAIAKKQDVYLCDNYDIEVKSSTGSVASPTEFSFEDSMTATLFGGVSYSSDSTQTEIWKYLTGTKTETEKIQTTLKDKNITVKYFSDDEATEEQFKAIARNSDILHISTHGFFFPDQDQVSKANEVKNDDNLASRLGGYGFGVEVFVLNKNPLMRSGLVLSGANDVWNKDSQQIGEDGVLTAQEVAHIDMRKTGLVVMSACETGLGDIQGSEGVYGLQRAFKMAGVKYMIMSLWQVADKETEEFMTSFYSKLTEIKEVKKAFSKTQMEMRQKYDPYFWAAFVLVE